MVHLGDSVKRLFNHLLQYHLHVYMVFLFLEDTGINEGKTQLIMKH